VDQIGETRLALLIYGFDAEHLGGGVRRGRAGWASSLFHLDRTRDRHRRRAGKPGKDALSEGRRYFP
jgi:hypothetical protein